MNFSVDIAVHVPPDRPDLVQEWNEFCEAQRLLFDASPLDQDGRVTISPRTIDIGPAIEMLYALRNSFDVEIMRMKIDLVEDSSE